MASKPPGSCRPAFLFVMRIYMQITRNQGKNMLYWNYSRAGHVTLIQRQAILPRTPGKGDREFMKAFRLTGLILGIVGLILSVTAIVFSAVGIYKARQCKQCKLGGKIK